MSGLSGRGARGGAWIPWGVRCDGSGYAGRARVESLTEEQAVAVCPAASELRGRAATGTSSLVGPTDWVRVTEDSTVCVSERLPRIACRSTASRRAAGEFGVEFRSMWFELAWPKHGSTYRYTQNSEAVQRVHPSPIPYYTHHTQPRLNPRALQDLSRASQTAFQGSLFSYKSLCLSVRLTRLSS